MERRQKRNTLMMAGLMVMLSFTQVGCNPADVLKGIAAGLNAVASGMSSSSSSSSTGTPAAASSSAPTAPSGTNNLSALASNLNSTVNSAPTAGTLPRADTR